MTAHEGAPAWEWKALPDRPCGDCNVCCISLTIDEEALQKLPGHRCKNLTADHRCGIYDTRPGTCRRFECGWRVLRWIKPTLRPDISGVLVRPHTKIERDGTSKLGVAFALLNRGALKAEGLAETVAAAVNAGLAVYLGVPGPPGFTSSLGRIDEVLVNAVVTKDKAAFLNLLRQAYKRAQGTGRDFIPVKLKHPIKPAEPEPGNLPPTAR